MEPVLLHDWSSVDGLYEDFEATRWGEISSYLIANKDDVEILLGSYTYECYSGNAFVLFRLKSNGFLYEVNGSHCSCYGLEGQWSPEEVTVEEIRHRLEKGNLGRDYDGRNEFADELCALLDSVEVSAPGEA